MEETKGTCRNMEHYWVTASDGATYQRLHVEDKNCKGFVAGEAGKPSPPDRTFEYLLNAMENAAAQEVPFNHGYAEKRLRVIEYVRELERVRDER